MNNASKLPIFWEKLAVLFITLGEVNVSQNRLAALLKTAEALKIKGLAEDSSDYQNSSPTTNLSPPPRQNTKDTKSPPPQPVVDKNVSEPLSSTRIAPPKSPHEVQTEDSSLPPIGKVSFSVLNILNTDRDENSYNFLNLIKIFFKIN